MLLGGKTRKKNENSSASVFPSPKFFIPRIMCVFFSSLMEKKVFFLRKLSLVVIKIYKSNYADFFLRVHAHISLPVFRSWVVNNFCSSIIFLYKDSHGEVRCTRRSF